MEVRVVLMGEENHNGMMINSMTTTHLHSHSKVVNKNTAASHFSITAITLRSFHIAQT